jgi:hypothetical protein
VSSSRWPIAFAGGLLLALIAGFAIGKAMPPRAAAFTLVVS